MASHKLDMDAESFLEIWFTFSPFFANVAQLM